MTYVGDPLTSDDAYVVPKFLLNSNLATIRRFSSKNSAWQAALRVVIALEGRKHIPLGGSQSSVGQKALALLGTREFWIPRT